MAGVNAAATVTATHLVRVPVTTVWSTPNSAREVDAAIVADEPDAVAWLAALDADAGVDVSACTAGSSRSSSSASPSW